LPEIEGLRAVSGEEAARELARGVDAVPDDAPKGARLFRPSRGWSKLVNGKTTEEAEELLDAGGAGVDAADGESVEEAADEDTAAGEELDLKRHFRRVKGRPVVSVDEAEKILAQYRIPDCERGESSQIWRKRGSLIDAQLAGDGAVEDSLLWESPIYVRMEIRRRILGLNLWSECPPPDRAAEPSECPIPY
jgi:hypothetical protein